jgi:molecular chaperone DnaK (HSP70)
VPARYLVGIDLGTTNTAVAYVDTRAADPRVRVFEVPQLVAPGEVAPRQQLPSFVYLAGEHDLAAAETALPWRPGAREVVGELARWQGARNPARMIASAKSWLCHPGVDRKAPILPWGEGDGPRLSPVASQAQVLAHIAAAWNHEMGGEPDSRFADQEVVVTCPASFDEAARELTLEAAAAAGLPPVVLLEEPQAAFYAWIDRHRGSASTLQPGERVLVFDVGGGTSDFTLITVDAEGGFERTAVGDHLLLGGDNVDLTLAKLVEQRLGKKLDALQWHGLVHAARLAKETLLGDAPPDEVPITVAGRGTKLIGGTMRDRIERGELERVLFDGFFPVVERGTMPVRGRGGLQEMGLPYASDPAVTRHLSSFLSRHGAERVDAVLFNGGAMTPASLRARVIEQIARWQGDAPRELAAVAPELAVAVGAAYYGMVRRGMAARIRGGTPRAFFLGVEQAAASHVAVCIAGKGLEEGMTVELDRDFELVTNRPVRFRLYSSTTRDDAPGTIVPIGDGRADTLDDGSDLLELPPIVTVLRARGKSSATVRLQITVTELGAIEIWCREQGPAGSDGGRWRLTFDMRAGGAAGTGRSGGDDDDGAASTPHPRIDEARAKVTAAFRGEPSLLAPLTRELEALLEARRDEWSTHSARALFDALADVAETRKRSADHEQRWLGLAGFCLRPGVGAPLDTWRARQLWGVFNEGLAYGKTEASRLAWWIVWRRIAGGLSATQQDQIYDRLAILLLPNPKQQKKLAEIKASKQELGEMWRVVAALERIQLAHKLKLGDELMRRMDTRKGREDAVHLWAISRLAARVPLYGPLNLVVPASKAASWLEQLMAWDWPDPEKVGFPLAQIGRRTADRARDVDETLRGKLAAYLRTLPGGERAAVLVEQVVALEAREERVALGDTLPAGLRLVPDAEPAAS